MDKDDLILAFERAYLALLRTPHDALRVKNQAGLCACRDALAHLRGWEAQHTQEYYESFND